MSTTVERRTVTREIGRRDGHRAHSYLWAFAAVGLVAGLWLLQPISAAALTGATVEDDASALPPAERGAVQRHADALASTGHPVLLIIRSRASSDEGVQGEAAQVMTDRGVETEPSAKDGVVFLVDLTPSQAVHGHAAIYVGAELATGVLPHDEVARIYSDSVAPPLLAGDLPGGLTAGLDALTADVRAGGSSDARLPWLTRGLLPMLTLVALLGLFVTARSAWRDHGRLRLPPHGSTQRPETSASVGGALVRGRATRGLNVAVLLELVADGAVEVVSDVVHVGVRKSARAPTLSPWGEALMSDLEVPLGRGELSEKGVDEFLSRRHAAMEGALDRELVQRGWLRATRPAHAGLATALTLSIATGAGSVLTGAALHEAFPEAACATAVFVGVIFADSVRRKTSRLTTEGRRMAAAWARYGRWLLDEVDAGRVPLEAAADAAALGVVPADRLSGSSSDLMADPIWRVATSITAVRWNGLMTSDGGNFGGGGGGFGGGDAAMGGTGAGGHF